MKKILSVFLLVIILVSCKSNSNSDIASETYQINISAKGVYNGMRSYIKQYNGNPRLAALDTAMVVNEAINFDGPVIIPSLKVLTVDGIEGNLPFILEEGILNIELNTEDISQSIITGSKNSEAFQLYIKGHEKLKADIKYISVESAEARKSNDPAKMKAVQLKNKKLRTDFVNYPFDYIMSNPNNEFSLLLLESITQTKGKNIGKIKESYKALSGVIETNDKLKLIGNKIDTYIKANDIVSTNIGDKAPNFSAPNPDGKIVSLNDIKGKVTIIDFWASWCRPCRVENPNVVRVYEKYKDKGLEIISVSLDKNTQKDRWLQAIKDDNLQWHHVSNLLSWNEPIAKMYGVRSIPATFILDENGTIVAKKLRGVALEKKIAELLN